MSASAVVRYYRSKISNSLQGYNLRVVVESATDMPKEIFVFQRGVAPASEADSKSTDRFICLADPADLEEIPVNTPNLPDEMPYYRVSEVTLVFRSMEILEATKALIEEDITALVNSLNAAANVTLMSEITYG